MGLGWSSEKITVCTAAVATDDDNLTAAVNADDDNVMAAAARVAGGINRGKWQAGAALAATPFPPRTARTVMLGDPLSS